MGWIGSTVRRHPVGAYVVLAAGLAWAYWIPMAIRGEVVTPGGSASHFPGLLAPLVAACIVTAIADGRAGLGDLLSRIVRWRIGVRWYAAAALPFVIFLATVAALAVAGGSAPSLADLESFSGLPVLPLPIIVGAVLVANGFGEEVGWRGFLTPKQLERHGPITASLLVGAAWIAWHVPSFAVIETYRNLGLAIVPMMGLGLLSGSVILTWLYIGSGGSILIASLWHLSLNMASATTAGRGAPGAVVWTATLVWAVVIVIRWLVAAEPANRPFMTRLRDGALIAMLRSPMGRWMDGMTVIGFRGRRSGRQLMTPVECVRTPGRLYVLVSHPDLKQWWRNVQADPGVIVEVAGHDVAGRAVVHAPGDPAATDDLVEYLRARPRVARTLNLPADWASDRAALEAVSASLATVRIDLGSAMPA